MKNLIFIIFIFPFYSLAQSAGDSFRIKGSIVDNNNNAIPFGAVSLYLKSDSTLIDGVLTGESGQFEIGATAGDYYLKINIISFREKIIPDVIIRDQPIELGKITLMTDSKLLDEVVITGERSQMQLDLDKRVFNVGSDLANIGGTAADILDNIPSVTVDPEGAVSLRGSENVRILIDGRPSGLTGISSPDALRLLQGNMIERVEVITNPSSRYDAEGEVGIINIILKKNIRYGLNGSFTANWGNPLTYGGSFDVSFRKNKFNLFSSYGYNFRSTRGSGSSFQRFSETDSVFSYSETSTRRRAGHAHNLRAGADYYINEQNILTAAVLYRTGKGRNTSSYTFNDFDNTETLVNTTVRNELEREPESTIETSLSYRKEFDKKGQLFTVDLKYIDNQELELADFTQTVRNSDQPLLQRSSNTEYEKNLLFQADYVHPFSERGKWEAGLKSTSRTLRNKFLVEEQQYESGWEILPEFDNNLVYRENIHAAYLMAGEQFGKFSAQAGLRGELSDIQTELPDLKKKDYQSYFNLFPSIHLSYELSKNKSLQLSYSRRLSRPGFRDLLPFSGFSNNRSIRMGNPLLRPEYTNSIEAGQLTNWDTGSLLTSIYYRHRTGVIERITRVDSLGISNIYPVNMAKQNAYGIELNASNTIQNWWRINANFNFYRAITNGTYLDKKYGSDTYTWTSRVTSKMTIVKSLDFQAGINYRGAQNILQGRRLPSYSVDLALAKDLFKGNGTATISVRDLFQTRRWRTILDEPGYYSNANNLWNGRQILLTLNFRLNRSKETRTNDNSGGGMDEDN